MMLSLSNAESLNVINVQPLKLKPCYFDTNEAPLSNDPGTKEIISVDKRRRINTFYKTNMLSMLFPDSPVTSTDGDGSPPDSVVSGKEAQELHRSMWVSHGSTSLIGRRRTMEDTIVVIPDFVSEELSFFAVYDGHGGTRVSNLCRDKLHQILLEEIKKGDIINIDWEKVMGACFKKMDDEVVNSGTDKEDEEMGSTATVTLLGKNVVVVANCGNSRAVLSRGDDIVVLSRDHKPDRPDEKERVESHGGRVTTENGSLLCGKLTTSRSIGDIYLKPYVISDPEVTVTKRNESDKFMIIASDGVWDVVSNKQACDIVEKSLRGKIASQDSENINDASKAAPKLAELAIAKRSQDNISVIVVELNKTS